MGGLAVLGYSYLDAGSASWSRLYREVAFDQAHSFANNCRSMRRTFQVKMRKPAGKWESSAVVFDDKFP
jgi:hypothetical protein